MKISVIIPTLNEEPRIGNLLTDLQNQTVKPFEVIVIDARSEDKTKEVVSTFSGVQFYQMHKGVGYQRQAGGEKAKGELLVFLDADTRIDTDFLEQVGQLVQKYKLSIACPRYNPDSGIWYMEWIYTGFNRLFKLFERLSPSGAGSCIITTKKVFHELGGFEGSLQFDDIAYIRKAGRRYGFKQLPIDIQVSDRRFHEYGVGKMLFLYAILSVLFFFGQFRLSNHVNYTFGKYSKPYEKKI